MAPALQRALCPCRVESCGGGGQAPPPQESWSQSFRLYCRGKNIQPKKRSVRVYLSQTDDNCQEVKSQRTEEMSGEWMVAAYIR